MKKRISKFSNNILVRSGSSSFITAYFKLSELQKSIILKKALILSGFQTDNSSLKHDWINVGLDIRKATQKFINQNSTLKSNKHVRKTA